MNARLLRAPGERSALGGRWILLVGLVGSTIVATEVPLRADPPPAPPPCNLKHDPTFCFRWTRFRGDPLDTNRWIFEFEIVNWTGVDIDGLVLRLNDTPTVIGASRPVLVDAYIDRDGRPLVGPASPPLGNLVPNNDWFSTVAVTPTRAQFGAGTPIPHRQVTVGGTTYHGIRDPAFAGATGADCVQAFLGLIPGSVLGGGAGTPNNPFCIDIPDAETTDDGPHALDGFVIEIDELEHREEFSLNWFLLSGGVPVGFVSFPGPRPGPGGVIGDPMGFGTLNVNLIDLIPNSNARPPIFQFNSINPGAINTAYNPLNNSDPHIDDPTFFAEDQVGGVDTLQITPIPITIPGGGTTVATEPGAAVTAPFRQSGDNLIAGVQVGTNFFVFGPPPPTIPDLPPWAVALTGSLLVAAGAWVVTRRA